MRQKQLTFFSHIFLLAALLVIGFSACATSPASSAPSANEPATQPTPTATALPANSQPTASTNPAFALAGKNLIVNGDAESGPGTDATTVAASIPGWKTSGDFNVVAYGSPNDLPSSSTPGPSDRGKNFFYGGLGSPHSSAIQTIDLSSVALVLASGKISYTFSAWLGGLAGQNDHPELSAQFLAADGTVLATANLPVILDDARQGQTEMLFKTVTGNVPMGTVKVKIDLEMVRTDGADNDAYADNLALVLNA